MNILLKHESWLIPSKAKVLRSGRNTIGIKWEFKNKINQMESKETKQGY